MIFAVMFVAVAPHWALMYLANSLADTAGTNITETAIVCSLQFVTHSTKIVQLDKTL